MARWRPAAAAWMPGAAADLGTAGGLAARRPSAGAGLAALLCTALLLAPFLSARLRAPAAPAIVHARLVLVDPARGRPAAAHADAAPRPGLPAPRSARSAAPSTPVRAAVTGGPPTAVDEAPAIVAVETAARAAPPAPASAASPGQPLRLGDDVVRRASQGSKTEWRRMAESSAAYRGDDPVPGHERLAQRVAGAGKPDCLRPGGSLLSAVVIAYELLADKCSKK